MVLRPRVVTIAIAMFCATKKSVATGHVSLRLGIATGCGITGICKNFEYNLEIQSEIEYFWKFPFKIGPNNTRQHLLT